MKAGSSHHKTCRQSLSSALREPAPGRVAGPVVLPAVVDVSDVPNSPVCSTRQVAAFRQEDAQAFGSQGRPVPARLPCNREIPIATASPVDVGERGVTQGGKCIQETRHGL